MRHSASFAQESLHDTDWDYWANVLQCAPHWTVANLGVWLTEYKYYEEGYEVQGQGEEDSESAIRLCAAVEED